MLLMQMEIAPDVTFMRYPIATRYKSFEEALVDARALVGEGWDEEVGRATLEELLTRDADGLLFDGGAVLAGAAHWRPRTH
jgi:hypothetical protein